MLMTVDINVVGNAGPKFQTEEFAQWVRVNQAKLISDLRAHYELMVFGGPAGIRP